MLSGMDRRIGLALFLVAIFGAEPVRADDAWIDSHRGRVFQYRSEFRVDSEPLIKQLDALKRDVESTLAIRSSGPIQLNLFRNRTTYMHHIGQRHPEGMQRRALFVKGPDLSRVYVYRQLSIETDIRHESTHAVLHNALPYLPLWLDEGLAEYFEVPATQRAGKNPHHSRLKWSIRFGWSPSLQKLEQRDGLTDIKSADYRESWAWVHFMLHGPKAAKSVLVQYIKDIQSENPPGRLSTRMHKALPNANAQLVHHIKTWKSPKGPISKHQ
ncbi:MAG: hypothetical protein CMJ78_04235 [Planctomycetaceae bacterium]|nr:hypothetical protein [Planctomycetaceae bacterium]